MIIGGAEDKLRKRTILTEFVAAAGGENARIAAEQRGASLRARVTIAGQSRGVLVSAAA